MKTYRVTRIPQIKNSPFTTLNSLFIRQVTSLFIFIISTYLFATAIASFASASDYPLQLQDDHPIYLPVVAGPEPARLVISATHIDSAISGEADEAIQLQNIGNRTQLLAGWKLATRTRQATFPLTTTLSLAPRQTLWCTAEATMFRQSFGFAPDCEWDGNTDTEILTLDGKPQLTNGGGYIQLYNPAGEVVDTLVYGDTTQSVIGWIGPAAQSYARGAIASAGQIWRRKRSVETGLSMDHDLATDWSGDLADIAWGRRVYLPGWTIWQDATLQKVSVAQAYATVTVAVGPEGLYQPLAYTFANATSTIDLGLYTFEHPQMTQVLLDALARGVQIRMMLEGSPPGGIDDLQRWSVMQLANAGAQIYYMAVTDDAPNGYRTRYRFSHAKYAVIDNQIALVGTENFNWDSMPVFSREPVGGRRGFFLITDAQPIVQTLNQIFNSDWQPSHLLDLRPYQAEDPKYGAPPADYILPEPPLYEVQEAPFHTALAAVGVAQFGVVSTPENALHPDAGVLGLIQRTQAGDEIRLVQLYEHKHWGKSNSNPIADPNPRLQALIDAARRGVRVHVLLDSFFDDTESLRSNHATVEYLQAVAISEGLDLAARTGNPTQGGIHAKIMLIRIGTEHWSAVGSLNGGEISHKVNREVVLLTDMVEVYARLQEVFEWDWEHVE